jgi:SAM-dependent methyltransferase
MRGGAGVVLTSAVDRQRLSSIAHSRHPIAAPIFGVNVNRLLRRADREPAARILDLGCGEGAWVLQALAHYADGLADGVDLSHHALERAAGAAAERGLADRLTLHERDARSYVPDGDYDLVLCVGSTHAFGGFAGTLEMAGRHVHPDGVLLVGEGFWQLPPTPEALAALDATPADFTDLAGLVDAAERAGWTPVYAHVSDAAEWDDYEWSWVGSLTGWAIENPGHPDAAEVLHAAREHRDQWLRGYRNVLGFATLVLRRLTSRPAAH